MQEYPPQKGSLDFVSFRQRQKLTHETAHKLPIVIFTPLLVIEG